VLLCAHFHVGLYIHGGKEQFVVFIWTLVSITEQSNLLTFTQHQAFI